MYRIKAIIITIVVMMAFIMFVILLVQLLYIVEYFIYAENIKNKHIIFVYMFKKCYLSVQIMQILLLI